MVVVAVVSIVAAVEPFNPRAARDAQQVFFLSAMTPVWSVSVHCTTRAEVLDDGWGGLGLNFWISLQSAELRCNKRPC
jgi:hypothetical protein